MIQSQLSRSLTQTFTTFYPLHNKKLPITPCYLLDTRGVAWTPEQGRRQGTQYFQYCKEIIRKGVFSSPPPPPNLEVTPQALCGNQSSVQGVTMNKLFEQYYIIINVHPKIWNNLQFFVWWSSKLEFDFLIIALENLSSNSIPCNICWFLNENSFAILQKQIFLGLVNTLSKGIQRCPKVSKGVKRCLDTSRHPWTTTDSFGIQRFLDVSRGVLTLLDTSTRYINSCTPTNYTFCIFSQLFVRCRR